MQCKRCGNSIPSKVLIDGKMRVLSSRRFCLDCSPFGMQHVRPPDWKPKRKKQSSKHVHQYRVRRKLKAIEYLGGKCSICGYSRCANALEFHHRDPASKGFTIGTKSLGFERLKDELDKCILVCANCHRELEAGLITLP